VHRQIDGDASQPQKQNYADDDKQNSQLHLPPSTPKAKLVPCLPL
jgi:hypothetical protein